MAYTKYALSKIIKLNKMVQMKKLQVPYYVNKKVEKCKNMSKL